MFIHLVIHFPEMVILKLQFFGRYGGGKQKERN